MNKSKILSLLMALIMLLPSIAPTNIYAADAPPKSSNNTDTRTVNVDIKDPLGTGYNPFTKEVATGKQPYGVVGGYGNETLQNDKTPSDAKPILDHPNYNLLSGGFMIPDMVYWTKDDTKQEYMAYCIDPGKKGYVNTDKYDIRIHDMNDIETDNITFDGNKLFNNDMTKKLVAAVSLGFNANPASEVLGMSLEESGLIEYFGGNRQKAQEHFDYAAYLSTKFAVWSFVRNHRTDGKKIAIDDWKIITSSPYPQKLKIAALAATKRIYNEALSYTFPVAKDVHISHTNSALVSGSTNKYESTYTITNIVSDVVMYIGTRDDSEFPSGLKMYDLSGNELQKAGTRYVLPANSTGFKAVYTNTGDADFSFRCDLTLHAANGSKVLLYGLALKENRQNYILAGNSYSNYPTEFTARDGTRDTGELIVEKTDNSGSALKGAVFSFVDSSGKPQTINDVDGNPLSTLKEIDGTHTAENLIHDTYYIKETKAPAGYVLQDTIHKMVVSENTPVATITVTNKSTPPPGGGIYKFDAITGVGLDAVTFDLYNSKGQLIESGMTDVGGKWTPKNITEPGTYTVIERSTNPKYQLTEPTSQVFTVPEDTGFYHVEFRDFKWQTVTIYKEDATTGEPIKDVQYQITQIDGKGAWKSVKATDSSGRIVWEDVPDGTYTVHEVSTVSGYILDPTPQYVTVRNGQAPSLKFLDSKFPGLSIMKIDAQTGEVVTKSATFRVEQIDGSFTADVATKQGTASLENIPVGTYKITEISAPSGYVLSNEVGTVHLDKGKSIQYIAKNLKTPTLILEKIDGQTGKPIAGVKFEIRQNGELLGTVTTGADGKVTIGMDGGDLGYLAPGMYSITEIFAPEPWVVPTDGSQHKDILLKAGDTKTLTFSNLEMPEIIVEKYDEETGERLPNAQFAIYEQADTSRPAAEGMTDKNGVFKSGKIKPGTYVVKELNPPFGYMFSDKTSPTRVIIAKAGDGEIIVKVDNIKLPKLTIKKIDKVTQLPLTGFTFRVEETDGTSFEPSTATTNADGIIEIPNLPSGTYTVTEIACPSEYILDSTPQTIKMEAGDTKALLFQNIKKPTLIVTKLNGLIEKGVPNTTFKIEYENPNGGTEYLGTKKTDENGKIIIPFVDVGWYVLTETIPAQGMQKPSNPVNRIYLKAGQNSYLKENQGGNPSPPTQPQSAEIQVTSGNEYMNEQGEIVTNYPLNSLVIKKNDAITSEMLEGAVFEVRKIDGQQSGTSGTIIGRYTTDSSGIIVIAGLEAGQYIVEEVKPPTNYLISENSKQTTSLKADGTSAVEITFSNFPYGHLLISKVDALTGKPLANARFKVTDGSGAATGNTNGEFITNQSGEILISNLKPNSYVVTELEAPANYVIDTTPQTINVGTDGKVYKVSFKNNPIGTLIIKKLNSVTNEPLANAEFKVTTAKGDVIGTGNGIYKTNELGIITVPNLEKGSYIVEETKAPPNFILENQAKTVEIEYGKTFTLEFFNKPMASLILKKIDSHTKQPLANAEFKISRKNGDVLGNYKTDGNGIIQLDNLEPAWYSAVEVKSPSGYILNDIVQDFEITHSKTVTLTFENMPMSSLIIKKFDAATKEPLLGARFKISKKSGDIIGEYSTDSSGIIQIDDLETGWYSAVEVKSPNGYKLLDQAKDFEIVHTKTVTLEFPNEKLTSLIIKKIDDKTGAPLRGAEFTVERQNGERVGNFTTDNDGLINIPTLDPDIYIVRETRSPSGYLLDESPKTVEVKTEVSTIVTFRNKQLAALQIKKVDEITGEPLAGAVFKVTKQNGEIIGEAYVTEKDGFINIPTLDPGFYAVSEVKAPKSYILDNTPKTVEIKTNVPTSVTFSNKPMSGLKILKLDSVTRKPLKGVEFAVAKMNGERIGNFKTDDIGQIYIADLEDGYYTVTEIKGIEGYITDKEPKTVQIQWGKPTLLEVLNDPFPALVIKKISSADKKPLANVKFLVTKFNGEQIGTYSTDRAGMIVIEGLAEGKYLVRETEAQKGFILDEKAHEVDIKYGKRFTLEVENKPMSSILIRKIDSVTKQGIFGVTFLLYDDKDNPLGQFISDDQGYVHLDRELPAGKYKLRELKPAAGYLPDDVPRTIYLGEGQTTGITWENTPQKGQIMITKRSSTFNEVTGLPAGSPLSGASFEVYNTTGNIVDKMVSDARGIAASKPLPMGIYFIKEVSAPRYYALNPKEIWAEIKHNGDIVRFEFLNESIMLDLTIQKKGPNQAAPGQTIMYDIFGIANNSSVALENFYIHDRIPTDATRVTKVVTGTFSERMYYKLSYKTNYHDYRVLAENLLTKNSYEYSLHPNALGLAAGEYVTDVRLEFPKASPGFKSIENMKVFCEVMPTIPKDYNIVNRADLGGRYGNEWESAKTSWNTKVWAQDVPNVPLPKTGY